MAEEPILKSHRRSDVDTTVVDVGTVRFGDGSYPVLAGPVVVESEDQIHVAADAVRRSGGSMLRSGTFRAETSPYSFRGLGEVGLRLLQTAGLEADLPTVTEVLEPRHVGLVADHVDMLEVGPDNMQNFVLLRAVGQTHLPVLLHRAAAATIDEWLMAAEYILAEDNHNVVLCERGSRTFDPRTSETIDISAVPVVQRISHLPVVIDPTPAAVDKDVLVSLALAGRTVGADGLIALVHASPSVVEAGDGRHLDVEGLHDLMEALGVPLLRDEIDRIDRELVKLLARRLQRSVEIGRLKAVKGLPLHAPEREAELIEEARADAAAQGLEPDYLAELLEVILRYTKAAQRDSVGGGKAAS